MGVDNPASAVAPDLSPRANLRLGHPDAEIRRSGELERRVRPLPPVALAIRELLTRFEICRCKANRPARPKPHNAGTSVTSPSE